MSDEENYLSHLNPAQKEAVLHTEGPLLVLAGAGAGKTRVVAHRICEIVRKGTEPEHILAITFTNKAAKEMRERTLGLLQEQFGTSARRNTPFVSTFHSLGLMIIKENYRMLGLKRFPIIFDRSDSLRAIKETLKRLGSENEIEPRAVLSAISRNKGEGITRDEYRDSANYPRERMIARAWEGYEEILRKESAYDFDDLLGVAVKLLRENPQVRENYKNRFRYIHIDEYQDTNHIQEELANLLIGSEKNVCVVGDIDQTIYTWRGAEIQNIMSFEKRYRDAKVVILEENYRSTKTILAASNEVISKNNFRVEKNMFTQNQDGEKMRLYSAFDENDEARRAAHIIDELIHKKIEPRDIAILYRANFQSRALEEALLGAQIPYQVLGTKFFDRKEVKDVLSFIRAGLYGADTDIARIANVPARGIGKVTLLSMLSGKMIAGATALKIKAFQDLLGRIGAEAKTAVPSKLVTYVLKESGMEKEFKEDRIEGEERLQNVKELAALASRYDTMAAPEGVEKFLEEAVLASDQDEMKEDQNAVRLMTVHAAKGLEFRYIFITGLEEGLFPYEREGDNEVDKEEERRLMYVALTRAKEQVFLSYASLRTIFGSQNFTEPSRFLADISESFMELEEPERLGKTIYLD